MSKEARRIPVTFDYQGMRYIGDISAPHGSGGNVWFLMIYKAGKAYFSGQLMNSELFGWKFHSNDGRFEDLADYFSQVVIAWYE